jgi:hypothetical protein
MPAAGRQLSNGWALALCYYVGFRGHALSVAVAVMSAESARYVESYHVNYPGSAQESTDRGLFQINDMYHPDLTDRHAYQAIPNARYALTLTGPEGSNFGAWAAYNSGRYLYYLPFVWACRVRGRWKRKIHRVQEELGV